MVITPPPPPYRMVLKPTVRGWRQDTLGYSAWTWPCVLSPPCGMETHLHLHSNCPIEGYSSKPTVWDGDQKRASASSVPIEGLEVLSPPCGMETHFMLY
jgi:hypothetical protein